MDALRDDCRIEKDPRADDAADHDHRRVEYAESAEVKGRSNCAGHFRLCKWLGDAGRLNRNCLNCN